MSTSTKDSKSLIGLTATELAEATKEYDEETDLSDDLPMTPEQRAWWERAQAFERQRDPSIPDNSNVRDVRLYLDGELIQRLDAAAEARNSTASELVAVALRAWLDAADESAKGAAGTTPPAA